MGRDTATSQDLIQFGFVEKLGELGLGGFLMKRATVKKRNG